MRLKNWESALNDVIQKHQRLPLVWGESDCFIFPMECALAITGKDPWRHEMDYTTEFGAAKRLAKYCYNDVGDAFAGVFAEIHPSMMGRGDIAVALSGDENSVGGCVCIGAQIVGKAKIMGLSYLPRSSAMRAFKVE